MKCLLFFLLFAVSESQVVFWTEPMDSTALPSDWTSTGSNPWTFYPTGGDGLCPGGGSYCWDFSLDAGDHIATTANAIDTSQHTSIELSYRVRINPTTGSAAGACIVEYNTEGTTTYQEIARYRPQTGTIDTTETFNSWNPSADANTNGLSLRIRTTSTNNRLNCYFNDFSLSGIAALTSDPSTAPNTIPPTSSPNTIAPTSPPNTIAPTSAPITASPNTNAPTSSPNTIALTSAPITASPNTMAPTSSPNNRTPAPSAPPTTAQPTVATATAAVYVNDVYKSADFKLMGNTPPVSVQGKYAPLPDYPIVAMPLQVCTRSGDDIDNAKPIKWACSSGSTMVSRCQYASAAVCEASSCVFGTANAAAYAIADAGGDGFGHAICPNAAATQTRQYMEVKQYSAYTESNDGCPGTPFDAATFTGFELAGTDRFATGVCVAQDNGKYILTQCNQYGGNIGLYSDAGCNVLETVLIEYRSVCDFINITYADGAPRWYRRFAGCYVNDVNIVQPTNDPTAEPTGAPTTRAPVSSPPTRSPFTATPSVSPTRNPSGNPTTTANPTVSPTKHPVTLRPTRFPVRYTNSPTGPPTESPTTSVEKYVQDAGSLSLIQYGIGALVVMYGIIGCWVWCHEKRKRIKILNPSDKRRKKQFADARARQVEVIRMQSGGTRERGKVQQVNSMSNVAIEEQR